MRKHRQNFAKNSRRLVLLCFCRRRSCRFRHQCFCICHHPDIVCQFFMLSLSWQRPGCVLRTLILVEMKNFCAKVLKFLIQNFCAKVLNLMDLHIMIISEDHDHLQSTDARMSERSDVRTRGCSDAGPRALVRSDARTSGRPDVRTLGRPDARTPRRPGVRTPGRSDACPTLFQFFCVRRGEGPSRAARSSRPRRAAVAPALAVTNAKIAKNERKTKKLKSTN